VTENNGYEENEPSLRDLDWFKRIMQEDENAMTDVFERLRDQQKARKVRLSIFQERAYGAIREGASAAAAKTADVVVRRAEAADAAIGEYDPRDDYALEHSAGWDAGYDEAYYALMEKAETAVETAVANALGYESWDAFLEARENEE
jgi:hypothetical protein